MTHQFASSYQDIYLTLQVSTDKIIEAAQQQGVDVSHCLVLIKVGLGNLNKILLEALEACANSNSNLLKEIADGANSKLDEAIKNTIDLERKYELCEDDSCSSMVLNEAHGIYKNLYDEVRKFEEEFNDFGVAINQIPKCFDGKIVELNMDSKGTVKRVKECVENKLTFESK